MTKKINLILIILMALSIANIEVSIPAAEAGETSGCDFIDRWSWLEDHASRGYHSWRSYHFYAGDTIVISAQWPYTVPLPEGVHLPIKGGPMIVLEFNDTVVDTAHVSGQLRYVFKEHVYTTVYWHNVGSDELMWDVNCTND